MSLGVSNAKLIGIDWGTSSLRAFLIDGNGKVLDHLYTPKGIMQVSNNDYEGVLSRLISPWTIINRVPMIASGMITSRNGWVETPYLSLIHI